MLSDPAKQALFSARLICLVVLLGSPFSAWTLWGTPAFHNYALVNLSAAVTAMICLVLTFIVRRPSAKFSASVFVVNAIAVFSGVVVNNYYLSASQIIFEPFVGFKAGAFFVALVAPAPALIGYALIAVCAVVPVIEYYFVIPPQFHSHFPPSGPWLTSLYALVSLVILFFRLRSAKLEQGIFLRGILDVSEEGAWMVDSDRRITFVNPVLCKLLGYTREEIMGSETVNYIDPAMRAGWVERMKGGESGAKGQYEIRLQRKDGSLFWTHVLANSVFDSFGNYQGCFAFLTDLTQSKILEERLRTSESYLRTVIGSLPLVLFTFDKDGKFAVYDGLGLKSIGRVPGDRIGTHVEDAYRDWDPVWMDSYRKARSGQEVEISVPLYGKKWQVRWSPVYDQSGKTVSGVAGVAIDDTERQSLLEDVDSRRELLQGVLDNMAEAVFAVGADGKFRLANKAARFLLNLDEGNPINLSIKDVSETLNVRDLEGRPIRSSDLVLARALRGESVPESLTMMRPIGGDRDIITLANAAPFRDLEGKGRGAVIVLRDVTDLVNFDRMKDQFIRVAAHELKTPVTVVKLNAQTLPRLMPQLEPRQKQILSFIVQGADRIDRIVRDLIDLSQLQIKSVWLSKVKVDLCALAQESYVRRKRLSDAREISLSLPASPIWIMADKNRVEQALDILLDNAVKYSPDGGRIDMSLEAHGDFVKATVKDSGVGIPKDKQAKIFERFYRAHTDTPYDYGGLGVGLYICREIVKGHEGSIGFESRESAGSSFYFSLPLAKEGSA